MLQLDRVREAFDAWGWGFDHPAVLFMTGSSDRVPADPVQEAIDALEADQAADHDANAADLTDAIDREVDAVIERVRQALDHLAVPSRLAAFLEAAGRARVQPDTCPPEIRHDLQRWGWALLDPGDYAPPPPPPPRPRRRKTR